VVQPEQSDEATSDVRERARFPRIGAICSHDAQGGSKPRKRNRIGGTRQKGDTVVQKGDAAAQKKDKAAQKKDTSEKEGPRPISPVLRSTAGQYSRRELMGLAASEKKKQGRDRQDSTGIGLGPAFEVSSHQCAFFPLLTPVQPSNRHSTASSNSPGPSRSSGTPTLKSQSAVGASPLQDPSQNQPTGVEVRPQTCVSRDLRAPADACSLHSHTQLQAHQGNPQTVGFVSHRISVTV
jgi:hypothetical protein